jgi:predicted metal-dependent enzyme (double-stranded beta helix superfamily)
VQTARREQDIVRHLQLVEGGLAGLVPAHDRVLSPDECEMLAVEVTRRGLWTGVELTPTESQTRAYALLHADERMELWLLSWLPLHSTGFHDHGESNVGFCVAQGTLAEQRLRFADVPQGSTLAVGDSRAAGADYIHCLEWQTGSPALSVHVYSPPLSVVGQYRYDTSGLLRREVQSGRDELTKD